MVVSDPLYYAAQVGMLVVLAGIAASIAVLLLRTRREPKYAVGIAFLALGAGAVVLAMAKDTVICGGVCSASHTYATKVYLLWAVAIALLLALAFAPWRRRRPALYRANAAE